VGVEPGLGLLAQVYYNLFKVAAGRQQQQG